MFPQSLLELLLFYSYHSIPGSSFTRVLALYAMGVKVLHPLLEALLDYQDEARLHIPNPLKDKYGQIGSHLRMTS